MRSISYIRLHVVHFDRVNILHCEHFHWSNLGVVVAAQQLGRVNARVLLGAADAPHGLALGRVVLAAELPVDELERRVLELPAGGDKEPALGPDPAVHVLVLMQVPGADPHILANFARL